MALQDKLLEIDHIAESLDSSERRRLLYLCESPETDTSVACVKEALRSIVTSRDNNGLFLAELVYRLERFDILRKLFKFSRENIERDLKHKQVLSRFRVLMAAISEEMNSDDVNRIKFLLGNTISRENLENVKNFLDVIVELEKRDSISPERVDFVEKCLRDIDRIDLAKRVASYKMSAEIPGRHSALLPNCRTHQTRQGQPHRIARVNAPLVTSAVQIRERSLELYKFNTNPRGVCLIIDCVGNDGEMLEQTFKDLHFDVILQKWLTADDTLSALKAVIRHRDNYPGDSFVCCIISRGTDDHLLGTDLYGRGLPMDSVRRLFTAEQCPVMTGKPKLFFIQRYSVQDFLPCTRMYNQDEGIETDGYAGLSACNHIPTDADVFWSHCWTDERQLEQGDGHRSVYLKALTDALRKAQTRKSNLLDVQMEVNAAVYEHNGRNPGENYHLDVKHTFRKGLLLN